MYYNNKKLALSIFWVILGITIIVLGCMGIIDSQLYSGIGGALCTVGIAQIVKNIKYRNDPNFKSNTDIELSDERLKYIRMKAWSYAGYAFVLLSGILSIVFLVIGHKEVSLILSYCICFVILVYWLGYAILKRKD